MRTIAQKKPAVLVTISWDYFNYLLGCYRFKKDWLVRRGFWQNCLCWLRETFGFILFWTSTSQFGKAVFENQDCGSLYVSACSFMTLRSPRQPIFLLHTQWPAQQHPVPGWPQSSGEREIKTIWRTSESQTSAWTLPKSWMNTPTPPSHPHEIQKGKPECIKQNVIKKLIVTEAPFQIKGSRDWTVRVLAAFIIYWPRLLLYGMQKAKDLTDGNRSRDLQVGAVDRLVLWSCGEGVLTMPGKGLRWTLQHESAATQLIGEDKRQVFMRQPLSLSQMKDKNLSSYIPFYHREVSEGKKNYQSFRLFHLTARKLC